MHEIRNYPYPQLHLLALQSLNPSRHATAVRESYEVNPPPTLNKQSHLNFHVVTVLVLSMMFMPAQCMCFIQLILDLKKTEQQIKLTSRSILHFTFNIIFSTQHHSQLYAHLYLQELLQLEDRLGSVSRGAVQTTIERFTFPHKYKKVGQYKTHGHILFIFTGLF